MANSRTLQTYFERDFIIPVGHDDELSWLAHQGTLSYQEIVNDIDLGEEELAFLKTLGLSVREEECIYLYYFCHQSHGEIAEKLGLDRRTVTAHINNAKAKMEPLCRSVTTHS